MNTMTPSLPGTPSRSTGSIRTLGQSVAAGLLSLWRLSGKVANPVGTVCSSALRVAKGDVCRVEAAMAGSSVRVTRGTVWLTGSPAAGDVILRAGDVYALESSRFPYVLQGMEDAEVVVGREA